MNATKSVVVCLALSGVVLANASFHLGTKLTWHNGNAYDMWFGPNEDTLFEVVYSQPSIGPTIEATYGPAWGVLTGRLDLAQASFFAAGGAALRLFPMLGLDLIVEPPTNWWVKPYVWAGARTNGYYWMPRSNYPVYQQDADTHWRGGFGCKYGLTRRIELFGEAQGYARDDFWKGFTILEDGTWFPEGWQFEGIGLASAEVGVRFALGK